MTFLSHLQVTTYWITNLSLNLSSFLFHMACLHSLFLSALKFPNIGSVKHSFLEAYWKVDTIIFQFKWNMKYVYSLLTILYHQLKVNRKSNVNFNLNIKYDKVRGKQKTL